MHLSLLKIHRKPSKYQERRQNLNTWCSVYCHKTSFLNVLSVTALEKFWWEQKPEKIELCRLCLGSYRERILLFLLSCERAPSLLSGPPAMKVMTLVPWQLLPCPITHTLLALTLPPTLLDMGWDSQPLYCHAQEMSNPKMRSDSKILSKQLCFLTPPWPLVLEVP